MSVFSELAGDVVKFSQRRLERITGITRRQLEYWERGRYLIPTRDERGRRAYSLAQAVGLVALGELRHHGVSDRRLREMAQLIPADIERGAYLVIVGRMMYARGTAAGAIDLLVGGSGWVMRVRDLKEKLL